MGQERLGYKYGLIYFQVVVTRYLGENIRVLRKQHVTSDICSLNLYGIATTLVPLSEGHL